MFVCRAYGHRRQNGGGPGGYVPPPQNCIILCLTILLPAMYGSRCICITVITHVPPLSFNPTDTYAYSFIEFLALKCSWCPTSSVARGVCEFITK